mmetsp:Transcript_27372/g.19774  ORF Transcript_27372/g.19774 Transcript_27372/m.19774 type:complete len:187 (-) Transcript_27372:157-717(-)
MLLFYHGTYDILYMVLMIPTQIYKLMIFETNTMHLVVLIIFILQIPMEISRLRFAYRGNINEAFPEMIAFLIFTFFFDLPFSLMPLFQTVLFPHERATYAINMAFIFFEFILGGMVMSRFMSTQSAAFYLRTAPLIDKNIQKKYAGANDIAGKREIQIGMQKYDKARDNFQPFKESDEFINNLKAE